MTPWEKGTYHWWAIRAKSNRWYRLSFENPITGCPEQKATEIELKEMCIEAKKLTQYIGMESHYCPSWLIDWAFPGDRS